MWEQILQASDLFQQRIAYEYGTFLIYTNTSERERES